MPDLGSMLGSQPQGLPMGQPTDPQQSMLGMAENAIRSRMASEGQAPQWAQTMQQIGGVDPLAANKLGAAYSFQKQDAQSKFMSDTVGMLEKLSQMGPDNATSTLSLIAPMLQQRGQALGVDLPTNILQGIVSSPGTAEAAFRVLAEGKDFTPQEMQIHGAAMRKTAPKDVPAYLKKVQEDRVSEYVAQLGPQMPEFVAKLKQEMNYPQDQPIEPGVILTAVRKRPQWQQSQLFQRAASEMLSGKHGEDLLTSSGVLAPSVMRKSQEAMIIPANRGELLKSWGSFMLADPEFTQFAASKGLDSEKALHMLPATELQPFIAKAQRAAQAADVQKAAATGVGVENAKRTLPIEPKDRSQLVMINQLLQGRLVQPPAGITRDAASSDPNIAYADDTQKKRFSELAPTGNLLNSLDQMSAQLITAETPSQALEQGLRLTAAAATKSNPLATAYRGAAEGFTSNLSRTIGAERGVLTDNDVKRIQAAMTSFYDTRTTRQLKITIMRELYDTAKGAVIGEITGKPIDDRSQVKSLVERLVSADNKALMAANPGRVMVRNVATGEAKFLPKGGKATQAPDGWKVIE